MKLYVLVAWTLDTILSAFMLWAIYIYLVKDIGVIEALAIFVK